MSDYLIAYGERLKRNQEQLISLINDVKEKYPEIEIYVYNDFLKRKTLLNNVLFFKGEQINSIRFHEVPYGWSGCSYPKNGNTHPGGDNVSMPFTADDVANNFKSVTKLIKSHTTKQNQPFTEYFESKKHYLNWYSFYKKYESV